MSINSDQIAEIAKLKRKVKLLQRKDCSCGTPLFYTVGYTGSPNVAWDFVVNCSAWGNPFSMFLPMPLSGNAQQLVDSANNSLFSEFGRFATTADPAIIQFTPNTALTEFCNSQGGTLSFLLQID